MAHARWALAALCLLTVPATAQQQVPQQQLQQQLQQQQLQQPPVPQSPTWAQMPRMQLERQFGGPLQDTIIQRWRDPVDGMICYIYLPITAPHSPPTQSGFVQYGATTIGSISCVTPPGNGAAPAAAAGQRKNPPSPPRAANPQQAPSGAPPAQQR